MISLYISIACYKEGGIFDKEGGIFYLIVFNITEIEV